MIPTTYGLTLFHSVATATSLNGDHQEIIRRSSGDRQETLGLSMDSKNHKEKTPKGKTYGQLWTAMVAHTISLEGIVFR
jgi:hypothetical protein